jgi:RNA polymerase sigma factor (sigma-70 family)
MSRKAARRTGLFVFSVRISPLLALQDDMGREPEMEPGRLCRTGGDDAELIAACRRGDTGAFGLIVERYQRAVCAVAFAAVRDRVLAEDIAQDTFVMAWSKLSSLKDVERLPAWLCGIARNLARARRRKLDREQAEVDVAGGTTPYDALDDKQTEAIVADALARVPETFREPLLLFYCEERSAKDVARMLGTTDQAVHQRLSRGRQYLANDVALFEHAVGRTVRPRRDLAAAVVAAIAVGVGSSSRVEASPRPRGTTGMMKIGAAVVVAAGLAGTTGYLVHRSAAESHAANSGNSSTGMALVGPSLMQLHDSAQGSSGSTTPQAHAPALPGANDPWHVDPSASYEKILPVSSDCAEVASHLTDLSLSNSMVANGGQKHFSMASSLVKTHFEQACAQGWSPEYIACAKAANDPFSMHFDCKKFAPADHPTLEKNAFFITQDRNATFPAEKDNDCASVARHLAAMHMPNADSHEIPAEVRGHLTEGFEKGRVAIAEMVEAGCSSQPWSEQRRTCVAAATTVAALEACD